MSGVSDSTEHTCPVITGATDTFYSTKPDCFGLDFLKSSDQLRYHESLH